MIAVAAVAVILSLDRIVDSRFDKLQMKIATEHEDAGMWFIQENVDKSGKSITNTTTFFDRILFRRRLDGKFMSITENSGASLRGNKREVSYLVTPFEIQETETNTKW